MRSPAAVMRQSPITVRLHGGPYDTAEFDIPPPHPRYIGIPPTGPAPDGVFYDGELEYRLVLDGRLPSLDEHGHVRFEFMPAGARHP